MDEDGHMPERLEEDLRFNGQITQPNHNSLSSRNCMTWRQLGIGPTLVRDELQVGQLSEDFHA